MLQRLGRTWAAGVGALLIFAFAAVMPRAPRALVHSGGDLKSALKNLDDLEGPEVRSRNDRK